MVVFLVCIGAIGLVLLITYICRDHELPSDYYDNDYRHWEDD